MATVIRFHHWDGGMGTSDYESLIGYCIESPQEVLKHVLKTHLVYRYKDLYRPIDDSYPNNAYGLVIKECKEYEMVRGMERRVTSRLEDLDLSEAKLKKERPNTNLLSGMAELRRRYRPEEYSDDLRDYRKNQIELCKEVFDIVNGYLEK